MDTQLVTLRDLAEQLGLTRCALHRQVQRGNLPVRTFSDRPRSTRHVTARTAAAVAAWHAANPGKPWPRFTETG